MKKNLLRISENHRLRFVALLMALFGVLSVDAATYYAIASGNWNLNTTWSLTSGGPAVGVGVWPVAGDNVYISEGATARTVTIPAGYAANCTAIFMGGASATAATLTLASSTAALNVSSNVIIYGPTGTANRIINTDGGSITINGNLEMGNGQTGNQGSRHCRVNLTSGTITVNGNLVFNSVAGSAATQIYINITGAGTFNLAGVFTINNNSGTLAPGPSSTFNFKGSAAGQTIPIGISNVVYRNLNINNTNGSGATLSAAVTATNVSGNISVQTGTLNNGGFAMTLAPAMNFRVSNGATFNLTGTSGMVVVSGGGTKTFGPNSTVNYAGTDQSVSPEIYGNLIFSDGGTKTMSAATTSIYGNWTNNATVDATTNSGASIFCGTTGVQSIGGSSSTTFYNLILNNVSGLQLGISTTVANILVLTSGTISTGTNEIIISSTSPAAINNASSSRFINGNLRLAIADGANTYNFPIGTGTNYAPVSMSFNAGTLPGSLTGSTSIPDHPNIVSSSFSPLSTVNRYWSFTVTNGLATTNYDAAFYWVPGDQDAPFNYNLAYVERFVPDTWTHCTTGALTPGSAQINGETAFGDFQIGNGCFAPPTATISGDFVSCAGSEVLIRVDLTGSSNWSYTWSDGTYSETVTAYVSPSFFAVSPSSNKTYTLTGVTDAVGCAGSTSGSATVITGPATIAPVITCCFGSIVEVPIRVNSFTNVGAISLTMNYLTAVLQYESYVPNPGTIIDFVQADESGSTGTIRISGIAETVFAPLNDNDALITLRFTFKGGSTDLTWNDSGDGTKCEYAAGPPEYVPYCDIPSASYYINGSVSDVMPVADFTIDDMSPILNNTVQLTDISTCTTSRLWSFDRPLDVIYISGDNTSPNPEVQFTDGGDHVVTLTVYNQTNSASTSKTIPAGTPGLWDGPTSSDWNTVTNWDNHVVPTAESDVLITTIPATREVHNYPHVTGGLTIGTDCNSITLTGTAELHVGGVLTINDGKELNIRDNAKVYANGH